MLIVATYGVVNGFLLWCVGSYMIFQASFMKTIAITHGHLKPNHLQEYGNQSITT
jgi:hypothetical protein